MFLVNADREFAQEGMDEGEDDGLAHSLGPDGENSFSSSGPEQELQREVLESLEKVVKSSKYQHF